MPTQLEITVDREIGNDTEQSRMNCLKYLNYGRELEREASGNITPQDLAQRIQAERTNLALTIFDELDALFARVATAQAEVEKVDEDQAFAELEKRSQDGPIKQEMIAAFASILDTVDHKHADIIKNLRDPGYKALKDKYFGVGTVSENE